MRVFVFAALALIALALPADARPRSSSMFHIECNVTMPCIGAPVPAHGARPLTKAEVRARGYAKAEWGSPLAPGETKSSYVNGINSTLQAKVASIQSACPGTVVISGVRHTRIAGTRRMSLHASGNAVDVRGPYRCIYGELRGWPGGYSTDAGRVRHIHISYDGAGGREMGLTFRHGHHRHRGHRA